MVVKSLISDVLGGNISNLTGPPLRAGPVKDALRRPRKVLIYSFRRILLFANGHLSRVNPAAQLGQNLLDCPLTRTKGRRIKRKCQITDAGVDRVSPGTTR
ncbi:hypothetical protein EVAR_44656_1 [Eumeta japonica]|uniref:Uncharacterized protein n=1 Tax=Eumeta variegata TaxID=151549 RepID=A0A4C1XFQ2_EUMVA|nr:hypothetical protein EVAR_44656_1 [Eumeta japonica]